MNAKPWDGFLPPKSIIMKKLGERRQETDASPAIPLVFVADDLTPAQRELLDKMIHAMGLNPAATPVLCAADARRTRFSLAIALGEKETQALLSSTASLASLRGRIHSPEGYPAGTQVLATYHPGDLLEKPHLKKDTWEDLKRAAGLLGLR